MNKEKRLKEILEQPRMFNHAEDESMQFQQQPKELYRMIKEFYKPDFEMVEIGSYSGGSTEIFALNVKKVYSVDPYIDNDNPLQEGNTLEIALNNLSIAEKIFIEKMSKYDNVVKIRKLSMDAVTDFEDESLDAVYIDGNHKFDSVENDIKFWYPKVKKGGIMSGHDYYENVKCAVDHVIGEPFRTFGDGSWLIIKGEEKLKDVYVKTVDNEEYGLFALILSVLGLLVTGKETYIDYIKKTPYYDDTIDNKNVWEYYFEQPYNKKLSDVYKDINNGKIKHYEIGDFRDKNYINNINKFLERSESEIIQARLFIKNRIKIKSHITEKVNKFYDDNMKGYKILGIQQRGTDHFAIGHGNGQSLDINISFAEVDKLIASYDKLFLMTDSCQTLEKFKEKYPDKLIHYDDALLSNTVTAIHRGAYDTNKYKLGEDVLIEGELLSKVDYLLAMNSNISLWAILKGNMQYHFIDKHIKYS